MLKYDRIDLSAGIDVIKCNNSRECIICHYWYHLKINFRCQSKVWNGLHNLIQKATSFNDLGMSCVKRSNFTIHFWYITKDEAMNLLRNADLTEKSGTL